MKCLILSGGTAPGQNMIEKYAQDADLVIGVDGAADIFDRYDWVPDILIGDFDTADAGCVENLEKRGTKVIRLAERKNQTDTEAAVDYALFAGMDELLILGAIGSRMDHTLANISMLVRADKAGASCRIVDEYNELTVSDRDMTLSGEKGQGVSILPLTGEVCVSADGLKYPLNKLILGWDSSRGVSNVMTGELAHISISGGYALIIKTLKDDREF